MIKFIFDLDGTITTQETLPLIAEHFNVKEAIDILTQKTIDGNIPFMESFIQRVHILGKLPVSQIDDLLENVLLYPQIYQFIRQNIQSCSIATGNISQWTDKLCQKVGCETFCSTAIIKDNKVAKIESILKKEKIVEKFQSQGYKVVFIGDGNNDSEAMRLADVSIACGLTHYPAKSVLSVCDYLVFSEEALCRQLHQLF